MAISHPDNKLPLIASQILASNNGLLMKKHSMKVQEGTMDRHYVPHQQTYQRNANFKKGGLFTKQIYV